MIGILTYIVFGCLNLIHRLLNKPVDIQLSPATMLDMLIMWPVYLWNELRNGRN